METQAACKGGSAISRAVHGNRLIDEAHLPSQILNAGELIPEKTIAAKWKSNHPKRFNHAMQKMDGGV